MYYKETAKLKKAHNKDDAKEEPAEKRDCRRFRLRGKKW